MNIVLKADQPTGKLTSGLIGEILTRGDHPRGIKVRLTDGRIGRVQSLSAEGANTTAASLPPQDTDTSQISQIRSGRGGAERRGLQDDYRFDPVPADTSSLLDYVKPAKQKKGKKNRVVEPVEEMKPQQQLEVEFPSLDSALVAAILADHGDDMDAARNTLSSLS